MTAGARPLSAPAVTTDPDRIGPVRRSAPTRALLGLVRTYQHLRAGRPSPCRFFPSCSSYALEALDTHGAGRGTWLATRRICRCHPWGGHGIDLVPERKAP